MARLIKSNMKSIYLREVNQEKMRPVSDKGYIQRMQINADKKLEFTIGVFRDTGRLTSRSDYESNYNTELRDDCLHVMSYISGGCIQLLKSGEWLLDINGEKQVTKNIKLLEEKLYNYIARDKYDEQNQTTNR
jgi:hypothetical protein